MSKNKENTAFRTAPRPNGSTSLAPTPQSEDFFTDSLLDASKIPTPSPKKPQAFALAYKGRRALGNTRALKAAWEASAKNPRPSLSEDEPTGRPSALPRSRPVPAPIQRPNANSPRANVEAVTPPGARNGVGRRSSTADVKSPPLRDLIDVYQRIADEEDLAAQEGKSEEEEENYSEEMAPAIDWKAMAVQAGPPPHRPQTLPPRSSRRSTPQAESPELNKENVFPDEVTSMSNATDVSFWAGITDQNLAAKMTPHAIDRARDNDRLQRALMNDRRMVFNSSGRSQDGDTQEVGNAEDNQVDDSTVESVKTDLSDSLPRKRRAFGLATYGKQMAEQRRNEQARLEALEHDPRQDSSQVDWVAAAADVALPSAEDSSTPRTSLSRSSSAASLHKQNTLDRTRQWELNDFTGQSLQVSQSPPVRVRTGVLGPIKDREIEHVARQAVTTNRLGEIREKDPQQIRRTSRSPSFGAVQTPAPVKAEHRENPLNGEGEQIPDTPVVVFRTSSSSQPGDRKAERDAHKDHDRLRRLASAMSNSPRSGVTSEEWSFVDKEDDHDHVVDLGKHRDEVRARLENSSKSPDEGVMAESTPQVPKTVDIAKTPVVTGAWTDTILPDTTKTTRTRPSRYTETPQVNAGGWTDTPADEAKRQSSVLEQVPEELTDGITRPNPDDVPPDVPPDALPTKPGPPQSALASLLGRARQRLASQDITTARESDTLPLGDTTIESLEDLLTLDADNMATLMRMGADFDARQQLHNADDQDHEFLEHLGSELRRVCANIHDTRKAMSRLEYQVNHDQPQLPSPGTPQTQTTRHSRDTLQKPWGSTLPLPKLFYPNQSSWVPRPTPLGITSLTVLAWYLLEQILCEMYSHPLYADTYDWPAQREPDFPFVLPTILYRGLRVDSYGPWLLGPVWTIVVAVCRIIGQLCGFTDGFVDSPSYGPYEQVGEGVKAVKAAAQAATSGLKDVGGDLSMMSDEYL